MGNRMTPATLAETVQGLDKHEAKEVEYAIRDVARRVGGPDLNEALTNELSRLHICRIATVAMRDALADLPASDAADLFAALAD